MNYGYLLWRPMWQRAKRWRYRRILRRANRMEQSFIDLDDGQLRQAVQDLYDAARARRDIRPLIPRALGLGREISRRTLGMRHYDVQLMGALCLFDGHIAEMDTGEGKTLMAPLAAFLYHLEDVDRCVHIVTANEYLAARDARWMGPLYEALRLGVGVVVPGQSALERSQAYRQPVVYAAAKEIVFDSLREPARRQATGAVDAILRPTSTPGRELRYDFAIVDEVDSVLIDQASSPLSLG
ncbi:MAG: hypothetical protein JW810_10245, partial [Sedimentisphaerales bacterium]|nr:hypothetical protein [Sedimentisphaerales bacterium]